MNGAKSGAEKDIDHFIKTAGLDTRREKEIGQHIGYRYDVNLVPDYSRLTPFLKKYIDTMGWSDLNWLEDVHLGYEEGTGRGLRPQRQRLGHGAGGRQAARQSAGPRHAGARALDQVPDVAAPPDGRSQQGLSQVLIEAVGGGMGPIRPEGEDLDSRRNIGIEHAVVPVGRLMERVPVREPRDAHRNAVALAVLFELKDRSALLDGAGRRAASAARRAPS